MAQRVPAPTNRVALEGQRQGHDRSPGIKFSIFVILFNKKLTKYGEAFGIARM